VEDIFDTIFVTRDRDELLRIDGLGPMTVDALLSEQFSNNWDNLIDHLGFCPVIEKKKETPAGDYVGKVFVLTGKMAHPRSYYVEKIEAAGGKEGSAVNSKTDYLVIQDINSTSTKARKARELGTKLISPEQLEEMLG
jgi:DNA ligase (NAD+)